MIDQSTAQNPLLSVIICIVSDVQHLKGCLESLLHQVDPPSMEIIVPYTDHYKNVSDIQFQFPDVRLYHVSSLCSPISVDGKSREHHDELRAIGIGLAKGEVISLLEDHGRADKYWAKNVMEKHGEPYVAIGGAIENEVNRPLNWAIYFCDFGRYQLPLKEAQSYYISDANISYKREALEKIKELWKDVFHETSVNFALIENGETLWLTPDIVVYQHRENLSLSSAFKERFVWGRSYAGTLAQGMKIIKRLLYIAFSPVLPFLLITRKSWDVLKKKKTYWLIY